MVSLFYYYYYFLQLAPLEHGYVLPWHRQQASNLKPKQKSPLQVKGLVCQLLRYQSTGREREDGAQILYCTLHFVDLASPQKGDLTLSGPPSGRGADDEARTRERRVPA
ncbi:hypothetical protein PoB_006358100 [Plakobranchus ocellatus]|uniref:Uncharacterized protein n=1 Tax=Plakobranchus ocellatus TaxID=259542 RepID=A0AAV4CYR6_9GAST|nr:hypothetical protein PoB_006358100 [Plakobranchus ocellatus]